MIYYDIIYYNILYYTILYYPAEQEHGRSPAGRERDEKRPRPGDSFF